MASLNKDIVMEYNELEARLALIEGRECDQNDYLIACFCGIIAGIIDSVFIGKPNTGSEMNNSILGKMVDREAEKAVENFANINIAKDNKTYDRIAEALAKEGLSKSEYNQRLKEELQKYGIPQNFSRKKGYEDFRGNNSKLTYLENKFKVSYDQSTSAKIKEHVDFTLSPDNHHIKSIAHWPDLIGLICSIADQFTGLTTFISDGELYRLTPDQNLPVLRGETVIQKIFFGFVNWFGHLLSDFCGSHSSKGRGDGIPIPFFGIFTMCDFGNFTYERRNKEKGWTVSQFESNITISQLAVKVFEQGYDARFAITMSIPVLLQDLMIRFIWSLKSHFVHQKPWKECIPTDTHKDLRMMLLMGNASLCMVDGADSLIRSKGNLMEIILNLNLIAWYKLAKNSLKEICIRFDFTYEDLRIQFEYLDYQLNQYIQKLQAIDYDFYKAKIEDLTLLADCLEYDNWDMNMETLDEYIKKHNIKTSIKNRDDFKSKLGNKNFTLKIGGRQ